MPRPEQIQHPNTVFERIAHRTGKRVRTLWEERGPRETAVAWITCLEVNGHIVLVQTYEHGGWELFTAHRESRDMHDVVADALNRCGVPVVHADEPVVAGLPAIPATPGPRWRGVGW